MPTVVITMKSTIIKIGNSKGVRLTRDILLRSGIVKYIEISVKKGEIKIVPIKGPTDVNQFSNASEASFAKDWLRPEEEDAWKVYQSVK